MAARESRRAFLKTVPPALAACGLSADGRIGAGEPPRTTTGSGRDLDSLIGLILDTPRDRRVAAVAEELRRGLSYRELLTGLYLAAVRLQSTHHVAVVHSANWVAGSLPARDGLLPLVWVMDLIGGEVAGRTRTKEPVVVPRTTKAPPPAGRALGLYHAAMTALDPEAGELAALALARSIGPRQTMELVWRYACRDGDDLGHKAIRLSNSWRTLDAIGWEHAETPLRYLVARNVRAEVNDPTYDATRRRVDETFPRLPPDWCAAAASAPATLELYEEIRAARTADAARLACEQLAGGAVKAGSVWDAVHLAAVELAARFDTRAAIRGWPVHAVTSTNALHFAFRTVLDGPTRLLTLLQAVCWVSEKMTGLSLKTGRLRGLRVTRLEPADVPAGTEGAVARVFDLMPFKSDNRPEKDRLDRDKDDLCCRTALAVLRTAGGRRAFQAAATRYLNAKADNSHDYKYAAAAFEDAALVSERWRPAFLAATVSVLHGPASGDSPVLREAREALAGL
jgi:hypothetical protein